MNPPAAEMRKWLEDHDYAVNTFGRISAEHHDIYVATTEGFKPKELNAVYYVNEVRRWMMDNGNGIERSMPIAPAWFGKFNREFGYEDTTEEVLSSLVDAEEIMNLSDGEIFEAAEAEGHAMNQERYTGMAYVNLQVNQSFVNLANSALFEANSALNRSFASDGSPTESTIADLREAYECLEHAGVFVEHLLVMHALKENPLTFPVHGEDLLSEAIRIGLHTIHEDPESLVGNLVSFILDGLAYDAVIKEFHAESGLYRVVVAFGPLAGTSHWLRRIDFSLKTD